MKVMDGILRYSVVYLMLIMTMMLSLASAGLDIGIEDSADVPSIDLITPDAPLFQNNTGSVNSSDFWDDLDTPSDILFSDLGCSSIDLRTCNGDILADSFQGIFNWTVGDDWATFSGATWVFNESKLEITYYNATHSVIIAGTIDSGTLVDTQHQDGSYDGVTFNFSEESGSPGLDLRMNFTGVDDFTNGVMRYKTSSLAGDYPVIQLWSYTGSDWEDYPLIAESESFATITQPVFDSTSHLQDGVVQMRIYKASNGNTNNHYYIDWVAISKGFGTPAGEETDPFSCHTDGCTMTGDLITSAGINATGEIFSPGFYVKTNKASGFYTAGDDSYLENTAGKIYVTTGGAYNLVFSVAKFITTSGTFDFDEDNLATAGEIRLGASNDWARKFDGSNAIEKAAVGFFNLTYAGFDNINFSTANLLGYGNTSFDWGKFNTVNASNITLNDVQVLTSYTETDPLAIHNDTNANLTSLRVSKNAGIGIAPVSDRILNIAGGGTYGMVLNPTVSGSTSSAYGMYSAPITSTPTMIQTVYGLKFGANLNKGDGGFAQTLYGGYYNAGIQQLGQTWTSGKLMTIIGGHFGTSVQKFYGNDIAADVMQIGGYFPAPATSSVSGTSTTWSAMFGGDTQINSNKKLILEGSYGLDGKGDSYLIYDSTNNQIDFFVDGLKEMSLFNSSKNGTTGISLYVNKNVSATGYITRTSIFDKNKDAWDYIKDADDYKTMGKIDHSKFYGYVTYEVPDHDRPINKTVYNTVLDWFEIDSIPKGSWEIIEINNDGVYIITIFIIKDRIFMEMDNQHDSKVTYYEYKEGQREEIIVTYPYKKVEEGVSLDYEIDVLRQAVYELKTELCKISPQSELCKK